VLGDAASYFDPDDIEILAEIMHTSIHWPDRLQAQCEAGLERAQGFSWLNMAIQTLEIYERFPTL
jgi:glycosyltransferase involved in cell wall biosynthesis